MKNKNHKNENKLKSVRDEKREKKEIKKEIIHTNNNHIVKKKEISKEIQVIHPVDS